MTACGAGASPAFAELFERHRGAVWGFFRRRVTDRSLAEDLSQETFVALFTAATRYEDRGAFRSYLFGIAYNVLSTHRRRPTVVSPSDVDLARAGADSPDLDVVLRVRQAIGALDAIDRDVVLLREFEALSYAEIAAVLAIPVNTVRSRLFRARLALKEKLQ